MSEYGNMTLWLKSPHATSSVLGPGYMGANYSAGETVKDEVLGTSPGMSPSCRWCIHLQRISVVLGTSEASSPFVPIFREALRRALALQQMIEGG